MIRSFLFAAGAMMLVAAPAYAAPCKDAKGKFVKCAAKPVAPVAKCRANGRFAKCGTPGARPVR